VDQVRTARHSSKGLREQILKAAAPFLKRHGTEGAPVDEIMKAAGVTSGALYSQFKNKEDLCTQAICSALDEMLDAYRAIVREQGREGLKLIVAKYLTKEHASNVPGGCAFAALGSDMAKASSRAKRGYEVRIQALIQLFADGLGPGPAAERRAKAQQILSTMLGAMTFARAMNDASARNELLLQARTTALKALDELGGRSSPVARTTRSQMFQERSRKPEKGTLS
jgi:TetR/AcrR family transcriptional repressor of nem operon